MDEKKRRTGFQLRTGDLVRCTRSDTYTITNEHSVCLVLGYAAEQFTRRRLIDAEDKNILLVMYMGGNPAESDEPKDAQGHIYPVNANLMETYESAVEVNRYSSVKTWIKDNTENLRQFVNNPLVYGMYANNLFKWAPSLKIGDCLVTEVPQLSPEIFTIRNLIV